MHIFQDPEQGSLAHAPLFSVQRDEEWDTQHSSRCTLPQNGAGSSVCPRAQALAVCSSSSSSRNRNNKKKKRNITIRGASEVDSRKQQQPAAHGTFDSQTYRQGSVLHPQVSYTATAAYGCASRASDYSAYNAALYYRPQQQVQQEARWGYSWQLPPPQQQQQRQQLSATAWMQQQQQQQQQQRQQLSTTAWMQQQCSQPQGSLWQRREVEAMRKEMERCVRPERWSGACTLDSIVQCQPGLATGQDLKPQILDLAMRKETAVCAR